MAPPPAGPYERSEASCRTGTARAGAVPSSALRLHAPQPYEDLDHTADVGLRVRGASAEEALGRLALAFGTLAAGGAPAEPAGEERVEVAGGPGLAGTAVALLRALLYRLATAREVPVAIDVHRVDEHGAAATVAFGRYDPARHAEGADVKAVTWHAARLEREGTEWVAQIVLDV